MSDNIGAIITIIIMAICIYPCIVLIPIVSTSISESSPILNSSSLNIINEDINNTFNMFNVAFVVVMIFGILLILKTIASTMIPTIPHETIYQDTQPIIHQRYQNEVHRQPTEKNLPQLEKDIEWVEIK